MEVILKPITSLIAWDKNPRTIDATGLNRLKAQLKKLGQYKPLLINQDNIVLGGNMRLKAMLEMGVSEAWVTVVETHSEQQMLEYALSDNDRAGQYSQEMLNQLVIEFPQLKLDSFSVDALPTVSLKNLIDIEPKVMDGADLPTGDHGEYEQITFTLSKDQAETVKQAMDIAKEFGAFADTNPNQNGNAINRVCEFFIKDNATN